MAPNLNFFVLSNAHKFILYIKDIKAAHFWSLSIILWSLVYMKLIFLLLIYLVSILLPVHAQKVKKGSKE